MFARVVGTPSRLSSPAASHARQENPTPNWAPVSASLANPATIARARARQHALRAVLAVLQVQQNQAKHPAHHARRASFPPKDEPYVNHAKSALTTIRRGRATASPAPPATQPPNPEKPNVNAAPTSTPVSTAPVPSATAVTPADAALAPAVNTHSTTPTRPFTASKANVCPAHLGKVLPPSSSSLRASPFL